jgi:hypothetical protein
MCLCKSKIQTKGMIMQPNTNFSVITKLAVIGLVAASMVACTPKDSETDSGDTSIEDTGREDTGIEDTGKEDTGVAPAGDAVLQGIVLSADGSPIDGVGIALSSGEEGQTDEKGLFLFEGLAEDIQTVAVFEKDGMMTTKRVFVVEEGTDRRQLVTLIERSEGQAFDSESIEDVRLDLGSNGHLTITPGSLVDSEGNAATGSATAYLTMIDVQDKAALRASPGDFQAEMADGSAAWLESFGMSEVLILNDDGEALSLADGETAELAMDIIMPIKGRGEASASIPFLIFDEATGLWIEQGTGTTTDWQTYVFPIDEFGHWNADQAYNTTCVKVRVEDSSGAGIEDVQVEAMGLDYTNYYDHFTNANGEAYMLVRRDSSLLATVYDGSGNVLGDQSIATPNTIGDCAQIEAASGVSLVGTFSL